MDDLLKQEQRVDQYLAENNTKAAINTLFDLIVAYAKNKDFTKSDALRQKLIDIDPMALDEIIRSGDIIEEEKSKSMDKQHMEIWTDLYASMSAEEANAVFFAMSEQELAPRDAVFEQEKKNGRLFFVDQGQLKALCNLKGQEILVKRLAPGDFAGDDTFFSISAFSAVSLIAESRAKVKYLEKSVLKTWDQTLPGLTNKLHDYCLKSGMTHALLNRMKLNRRVQKRHNIKGKAIFNLLDRSGKKMGSPFKGTLSDISRGGLSFFMRISKKETARLLLGRKIAATFNIPTRDGSETVTQSGAIIGIHEDSFDDYSLHVRFDSELTDAWMGIVEKSQD